MMATKGMDNDWQDDPMMKAAAFEGLASNPYRPLTDRLACALQAIKILRGRIEELDPQEDP